MSASIDGQLRFAIAGKRLLEVSYKGAVRIVEPHDYGVQQGKTRLLAYQRRTSGRPPGKGVIGWRLFEVPLIERCTVRDETFRGSRGADQSHHVWDVLYARVE
jgi:hypothetical protein